MIVGLCGCICREEGSRTYINNINTGQVIPPNMYNSQEIVKPIADSSKIVYNSNSNFIADNTKPQSNYMNIRGNKP